MSNIVEVFPCRSNSENASPVKIVSLGTTSNIFISKSIVFGSIISPTPFTNAGLPVMKKGTSLPIFSTTSLLDGIDRSYVCDSFEIIVPAFELPPPKPDSVGIFLIIFISKYFEPFYLLWELGLHYYFFEFSHPNICGKFRIVLCKPPYTLC